MEVLDEHEVCCPYCGEFITLLIDLTGGAQQFYEDCSVCCAPMFIVVETDNDGDLASLVIRRDNE